MHSKLLLEPKESALYLSPFEKAAVDSTRIPRHVAIIMDGNRRWAKRQGLIPMMGHWRGVEALKSTVQVAAELGVQVLTVYSFSTENWARPQEEVESLMELLQIYLTEQKEQMIQDGVVLEVIGDYKSLPPAVQEKLEECRLATRDGKKITLVLALNYGGRDEIRRAAIRLAEDMQSGKIEKEAVTEDCFARYLDTAKWGNPDFFIRTSGEHRVSNFLLWQISYTEIFVTPVLWPDFSQRDFLQAILEYQRREKRLGG